MLHCHLIVDKRKLHITKRITHSVLLLLIQRSTCCFTSSYDHILESVLLGIIFSKSYLVKQLVDFELKSHNTVLQVILLRIAAHNSMEIEHAVMIK